MCQTKHINLQIVSMKGIYMHAMVVGHCKDGPWYYFLLKLKITIFQIFTKLGISMRLKLYCLQSAQHTMPNKANELMYRVYNKHIQLCHSRRALNEQSMALLYAQTQNYHISNIGKIGHLSQVKIVLFVVSIAYCAKQSM